MPIIVNLGFHLELITSSNKSLPSAIEGIQNYLLFKYLLVLSTKLVVD